jgi:hypothetical protein
LRDRDKPKIGAEGKVSGREFTVASLHVKAAKVVYLMPILQILQIVKSTSYVESEGWGPANPSSSATQTVIN